MSDFYVPRDEWETMSWEWIPDNCPVLIAIVEAFEKDKTAPGAEVTIQ